MNYVHLCENDLWTLCILCLNKTSRTHIHSRERGQEKPHITQIFKSKFPFLHGYLWLQVTSTRHLAASEGDLPSFLLMKLDQPVEM